MRVYLSGGFVTDWQLKVMESIPEVEFYNPADFELRGLRAGQIPVDIYGPMDLAQIKLCDVVFAYMESSNPTPINICFEVGYALGLGKTIVLCNEWTQENIRANNLRPIEFKDAEGNVWYKPHYSDFINHSVDFYETDFGRAIEILKAITDARSISKKD